MCCKRTFCVCESHFRMWLKWLVSPSLVSRRYRVTVCMCLINGAELGDGAEASDCGNSSTSVNHTAQEWRAMKSITPNLAPAVPCRTPSFLWINRSCFKTFKCVLWAIFFFYLFLMGAGVSVTIFKVSYYILQRVDTFNLGCTSIVIVILVWPILFYQISCNYPTKTSGELLKVLSFLDHKSHFFS